MTRRSARLPASRVSVSRTIARSIAAGPMLWRRRTAVGWQTVTGGRPMRNDPFTDDRLIREVEQFLYREARLLDSRRFREWLELFTEDVRYWMINRANRYPRHSKAIAILDPARYVESDLAEDDELAILDEDKQTLTARIDRLDICNDVAWAEDPPSRTRHIVANIE